MKKRVVKAFLKSAYDFSSVQMGFPDEIAEEIRAWGMENIPSYILAADGREDDIHVTVKYGIHIIDFTEIREIFNDVKPVEVKLGKITLFEISDDFDVVKIDLYSPELHQLNSTISKKFEVTDTYPEYHPHCTLAYVKKGCGTPYNGNTSFEGRKIILDSVFFSGKDNRKTEFKIKKAYFNQATWLPGRSTKEYPNFQKVQYREKSALYICISCHLRRFMPTAARCPRCGHSMKRF
jgi:2'-5' RNA ligase